MEEQDGPKEDSGKEPVKTAEEGKKENKPGEQDPFSYNPVEEYGKDGEEKK